ncbi:MAG: hypothetical protein IJE26_01875 [Oscillospiraceae bacterium]|nr:hypothetical protein [Oscillospiraceae bacterium]
MERETFERVWQRVQGRAGMLERQLAEEAESVAFYRWLMERCPSCRRETAALRREAEASLRALREEYFLRGGESWEPPLEQRRPPMVISALRQQYRQEQERAAGSTGALRVSREKRAAILRGLLLRLIN